MMAYIKSFLIFIFIYFTLLRDSNSHNPEFQNNLQECPMKKMEINYKSQGRDFKLGDLPIYETKNTKSNRLLISVYDIFGDAANTRLFNDILAEVYDFIVVLPDFFRGRPWDWTQWPPIPKEIKEWSKNVADWETIVKPDIYTILEYYRSKYNITQVGIFGFCFGGMVSTLAGSEINEIQAAAFVHPSNVTDDMASNVKVPMYIMPCKDDPKLTTFYKVIKEKFGESKTGYRRFDDVCHGFATQMGNFSDPKVFNRVLETIHRFGDFFNTAVTK